MLERMRQMLDRWRKLDEIGHMDPRAVADLGCDRAELEKFARMPQDVPERMDRMAELHGLSHAALRRDWGGYLEMVELCGQCGARKICSEVRDSGTGEPQYCGFCPNAETYRNMARNAAH